MLAQALEAEHPPHNAVFSAKSGRPAVDGAAVDGAGVSAKSGAVDGADDESTETAWAMEGGGIGETGVIGCTDPVGGGVVVFQITSV